MPINIGSGDTVTVPGRVLIQGDNTNSALWPPWVRNNNRWAMFLVGDGFAFIGPDTKDVAVDFVVPPIQTPPPAEWVVTDAHLNITMPCFSGSSALNSGDVILGPLVAQILVNEFLIIGTGPAYAIVQSDPFFYVVDKICGGTGPPPPPPPPDGTPLDQRGVDVLYWQEGYTIAEVLAARMDDGTLAPTGKLQTVTRWHETMPFTDEPVTVDAHTDCTRPKLSHRDSGPPLGLLYVRAGGVFRQESLDYGETWKPDPDKDMAFKAGDGGMAAVEAWNERTGERCNFYTAGKGISVDVFGPDNDLSTGRLRKVATYVVAANADNASFGAIYIRQSGAMDCVFQADGKRKVFRSHDDGRTFSDVT